MELHPPKAPVPKKPRIELGNARGIALATTLATEPSPGALVGGISHAARTVAAQSLLRWRFAYWGRQLYPRSAAARRIAEAAGAQLKTDLKAALASADQPLAAALKRDIDDLEHVLKSIAAPTAGGVLARPHLSELTRLEVTALTGGFPGDEGDALRAAFRRWREVTVSYDMTNLETAGTALSSAIDGALTRQVRIAGKYKSPSIYRKSISSAVRTLSRSQPRGEAIDALRGVEAAISKSSDPALRKIWCEQILPALSSAPHLTGRLANVIDGITTIKATDKAALDSAVSRIKGVLAEMIATSVPAYRDALMEATRNADQLAASLNLRALRASGDAHAFVPPWRVLRPQFDLRAPGVTGKGMQLYFDDAVLVVNEAATPAQAYVLFAAQVKGGDASTAGAVAQMIADQTRLLKGRLRVGATLYELRTPPDIGAVTRVFVGTKTPPGAAKLSGRIRLVSGPADGIELARFATFALEATGRIK